MKRQKPDMRRERWRASIRKNRLPGKLRLNMASNPRKRRQPCSRSRRNRIKARNTLRMKAVSTSSMLMGASALQGGLLQVVCMPPHLQPHTQLRLPQQGQHPGPPELHLQGLRLQPKYHFNGAQPYEFLLARKDMIVNIFLYIHMVLVSN